MKPTLVVCNTVSVSVKTRLNVSYVLVCVCVCCEDAADEVSLWLPPPPGSCSSDDEDDSRSDQTGDTKRDRKLFSLSENVRTWRKTRVQVESEQGRRGGRGGDVAKLKAKYSENRSVLIFSHSGDDESFKFKRSFFFFE